LPGAAEVAIGTRHKTKRSKLSILEKVKIVEAVVVQHRFLKDIARECRVSQGVLSQLMRKLMDNPSYISDLIAKEAAIHEQKQLACQVVRDLVQQHTFIDSA
jgi:hypothetical protein